MIIKKARDLRPGDYISIRTLANPHDPTGRDVAHVWSEVVMIEPMTEALRVSCGDDVLILEGNEDVEVRDAQ